MPDTFLPKRYLYDREIYRVRSPFLSTGVWNQTNEQFVGVYGSNLVNLPHIEDDPSVGIAPIESLGIRLPDTTSADIYVQNAEGKVVVNNLLLNFVKEHTT